MHTRSFLLVRVFLLVRNLTRLVVADSHSIDAHLRSTVSFLCPQPVSEWTLVNVVEWMSALNLYRYVDVFKSKGITGSDLLHLDQEKLMVSIV